MGFPQVLESSAQVVEVWPVLWWAEAAKAHAWQLRRDGRLMFDPFTERSSGGWFPGWPPHAGWLQGSPPKVLVYLSREDRFHAVVDNPVDAPNRFAMGDDQFRSGRLYAPHEQWPLRQLVDDRGRPVVQGDVVGTVTAAAHAVLAQASAGFVAAYADGEALGAAKRWRAEAQRLREYAARAEELVPELAGPWYSPDALPDPEDMDAPDLDLPPSSRPFQSRTYRPRSAASGPVAPQRIPVSFRS